MIFHCARPTRAFCRPRVARAQKIIRLHPSSIPRAGGRPGDHLCPRGAADRATELSYPLCRALSGAGFQTARLPIILDDGARQRNQDGSNGLDCGRAGGIGSQQRERGPGKNGQRLCKPWKRKKSEQEKKNFNKGQADLEKELGF